MKILHIVGGNLAGGAARGAYWLHKGLLDIGIDSAVLTNSEETFGDESVFPIAKDKIGKLLVLIRDQADSSLQMLYQKDKQLRFSAGMFGYDFTRTDVYKKADIVHLHWICGGMVNIRHLSKIKKPIVWTMRDMWPMTGGCHIAMDCKRYISGCGRCPQIGNRKNADFSRFVWRRKHKHFPKHMKLVGISQWLTNSAHESLLLKRFDVQTIHNNVSCRDFFPVNKRSARDLLGLPQDQPIVLSGGLNLNQPFKGFNLYLEAIQKTISQKPLFVFFGKIPPGALKSSGYDYLSLGTLHDTISLRLAYSAADVFVAPSLYDSFGKTLAEAMACGTPVVCFNATGPKDIVDHKINGYLAQPYDPKDMANGIDWVINNEPAQRERLSAEARKKVLACFDASVIARKYLELYKSLF